MYKALFLSPIIPSYNVKETVQFFTDILQFSKIRDDETYSILIKENVTVHICPAGDDIGEIAFYFEVNDVDTLWNTIKDQVKNMKVREPFDREYGMREIHIIVPHTKALMFIGQVNSKTRP